MTYIFELNHPKHYYQFKYIMQMLKEDGHKIHVLARDKDVLLNVLQEEGVPYEIFGVHAKTLWSKISATPRLVMNYLKIAKHVKPDVIVSKASLYGVLAARRIGAKSVIFPDSEVVKLTNHIVAPMCTCVVTPETFGLDFGKKHKRVKGFFENCYLAPTVLQPSEEIVKQYGLKRPYALLRFVGWNANHDVQNSGFSLEQKRALVHMIAAHMQVYISSEKKLPEDMEPYRLPTPSAAIHHVLAYADLYIGDSQTMATEAALLGTPAIRSNSFVGQNDMTNFIVLEKEYGLLRNIREYEGVVSEIQKMLRHSEEIRVKSEELEMSGVKAEWVKKREAYFAKVGDTNREITEMLENI